MPYIKQSSPPFAKVARLIRGYGLTASKLAKILGVSEVTARKRLVSPELLSLKDIDRISRYGHIPMEELRESISK